MKTHSINAYFVPVLVLVGILVALCQIAHPSMAQGAISSMSGNDVLSPALALISTTRTKINDGVYPPYVTNTHSPDITKDENGILHAVWMDTRGGLNTYHPFYSQSRNNGLTWSPNIRISNWFENLSNNRPSIASCGGTIMTTWFVWTPTPKVYLSFSTNKGATWSDPVSVNNSDDYAHINDDLMVNPQTCAFHLFTARGGGGGYAITHTLVTMSNGVPIIGTPSYISSYGATQNMGGTQAAIDKNGTLHVAWPANQGSTKEIYYNYSHDDGVTWHTDEEVSDYVYGVYNSSPDIEIGPVGSTILQRDRVVVAWDRYYYPSGEAAGMFVSERTDQGWTTPVLVTPTVPGDVAGGASIEIVNNKAYILWGDSESFTHTHTIRLAYSSDLIHWNGEHVLSPLTNLSGPTAVSSSTANMIGGIFEDYPDLYFARDYLISPD